MSNSQFFREISEKLNKIKLLLVSTIFREMATPCFDKFDYTGKKVHSYKNSVKSILLLIYKPVN